MRPSPCIKLTQGSVQTAFFAAFQQRFFLQKYYYMSYGKYNRGNLGTPQRKVTRKAYVGTQSDILDQQHRTEPDIGMSDIGLKCVESDIISDIGINFFLISNIRQNICNSS